MSTTPSLIDRLRLMTRSGKGGDFTGMVRVGGFTRFSATAWEFARVANSVYGNPTGFRCVTLHEVNLSRPPWCVFKKGTKERIEDHPFLKVLNRPWPPPALDTKGRLGVMSGTMMQRAMARDLELTGKSFWLKIFGADGNSREGPTTGLRRLAPQRMTVIGNQDDELLGFIYQDRSGQRQAILPEWLAYMRYPHPERFYDGIAPAIQVGLPAETDTSASRFNYDLLANDAALPGYIAVPGLSREQFVDWKASWEAGENPGKTRFIGGSGNAKYIKIGQTNQELTYHELRADSMADICRGFSVPRYLVDPENVSEGALEASKVQFWQENIIPKIVLWSDELSAQLSDDSFDIGMWIEDIEEVQAAQNAIVLRAIQLLDRQVITINETRKDLKKDPVDWGDEPVQPVGPMKVQPSGPVGDNEDPTAPETPPGHVLPVPKRNPPARQRTVKNQKKPTGTDKSQLSALIDSAVHLVAEARPDRRTLREEFLNRVATYRARSQRRMQNFYDRQGRVISARIRNLAGKKITVEKVYDRARWIEELRVDTFEILEDVADAFGSHIVMQLHRSQLPIFDPNADPIRDYITTRSTEVAGLVADTTEAELRQALADAQAEGGDIEKIASSIASYFEERGQARAETFARTEILGAANQAAIFGAIQSGLDVVKTWTTAGHSTDDVCEGLDGVSVAPDEHFPGGFFAPPEPHPNCECVAVIEVV